MSSELGRLLAPELRFAASLVIRSGLCLVVNKGVFVGASEGAMSLTESRRGLGSAWNSVGRRLVFCITVFALRMSFLKNMIAGDSWSRAV